MKRSLLYFFTMTLYVSTHAQWNEYALPKVENGRWYIIRGNKKIQLPADYNYVNHFDNTGYAYFCNGSKYGIIDTTGKIVLAAKQLEIIQYSNGLFRYAVEKGYLLYSLKHNEKTPCSWSKEVAEKWLYFKQEGNHFIMHTSWKNPISITGEHSIQTLPFNYLYVLEHDSSAKLYQPDGSLLEENPEIIKEEFNTLYVKGSNHHFIINSTGKIDLPLTATSIRFHSNYYTYCFQGKVHLIENEHNKELFSTEGDNISTYRNKYYVYKNNLVGLLDVEGEQILAPIYRNFYELQGNYIVNKNGNVGMLDVSGKELIPIIYQSIIPQGEFYRTTLSTGTQGLISSFNYTQILAPNFNKISTNGTSIRAWDESRLIMIELTKNHQDSSRYVLNNVISMNIYKEVNRLKNFDSRLFKIGWYYERKTTSNEVKRTKTTNYLWGISIEDSVRISARYKTPIYIENADFSLVPSIQLEEKISTRLFGSIEVGKNRLASNAFNYKTLKTTNKSPIIVVDSTDFYTKEFARIHTNNSLGIILKSGVTRELLYIDDAFEGFTRYCKSGEIDKNSNRKGNLKTPNFLIESGIISNQHAIKIKNGSWNYLNSKGDSLFKQPFLYAENFYKKTAIVLQKKGYGVIREDSLIIPSVFNQITRISSAKDTLFLVKRSRDQVYFLDSNLQLLNLGPIKLIARSDSLQVIQNGSNYQLLTTANKVLETSSRIYFLANNHYVIHKENKNYIIRNSQLKVVGQSVLKPLEFINETHFIVENHNKRAVFNLQGDTIIGFDSNYLEHKNGFVCTYEQGKYIRIYNSNFKAIAKKRIHKYIDISEDLAQKNVAITIDEKVFVYNQNGKQIAKITLQEKEQLFYIYFNFLITSSGRILNFQGICINPDIPISSYVLKDSNYFIFHDIYDRSHILTSSGSFLLEEIDKYNLSYHGQDVISYRDNENQLRLVDLRNNQNYLNAEIVKGKFANGYLLLKIDGNYEFVDRNFQNIFQKSFDDANPFEDGFATVMIDNNWTLIGKQGFQKALPNFTFIEHQSMNLYSIETHHYYGVYDSHGKVIVEPTYLKINFLDQGIIQATKFGIIDYFTLNGQKIDD